jgi:hypothetical protein
LQAWLLTPYCRRRFLLAAQSSYFRKRLESWDDDPLNITEADRQQLLVVQVEEGMLEAAQSVIQLMYEEAVPTELDLVHIAKVGVDHLAST